MSANLGSALSSISASMIASFGENVTLSRRPATAGGAHTTQTVKAMVCPLNQYSNAPLRMEGFLNVNENEAHFFMFPPGTDVEEAIDDIIHQGQHYRVLMQDEQTLQGTQVLPFAVAARID